MSSFAFLILYICFCLFIGTANSTESSPENLSSLVQITASSAAGRNNAKYSIEHAIDADIDTWWASAAKAQLPQTIELSWDETIDIDVIAVILQTDVNPHIYAKITSIDIRLSDGTEKTVECGQGAAGTEIIRFNEVHSVDAITIIINKVAEMKTFIGIREIGIFLDTKKTINDTSIKTYIKKTIDTGGSKEASLLPGLIQEPGKNLIADGGFENASIGENIPEGWIIREGRGSGQHITVTDEKAYKGEKSVLIEDDDPVKGIGILSKVVPVIAGETYRIGCMVYSAEGDPHASFFIQFFDNKNNRIYNKSYAPSKKEEWFQIQEIVTAPPGSAGCAVMCNRGTITTGKAYFDEVEITPVSPSMLVSKEIAEAAKGIRIESSLDLRHSEIETLKYAIFDKNLNSAFYLAKYTAPFSVRIIFDTPRNADCMRLFIRETSEIHGKAYARWKKISLTLNRKEKYTQEFINAFGPNEIRFPQTKITDAEITFLEEWNPDNKGFALNEADFFIRTEAVRDSTGKIIKGTGSSSIIPEGIRFDYSPQYPTFIFRKDDVMRARKRITEHTWAGEMSREYISAADKWLAVRDEEILSYIPRQKVFFVYGLGKNLCPLCGTRMIASGFQAPGIVKCGKGHTFPDSAHPDEGGGWIDPKKQEKFYFNAIYNDYVITQMRNNVLKALCYAYALTGDERYAAKAALILDAIAMINPLCFEGPLDYPGAVEGKKGGGRMNMPLYQVARALQQYAAYYDILRMSKAFESGSVNTKYKTIEENVRYGLILDSADYCMGYLDDGQYRFTNGSLDFGMGGMAAGIVLGIQYWINYLLVHGAISFPAILANTFDRDGCYYETSLSYETHTRHLWEQIGNAFINMRSDNYPEGYSFYRNPVFKRMFFRAEEKYACAGHQPMFGDSGPDKGIIKIYPEFTRKDVQSALQLWAYDAGNRKDYTAALRKYAGTNINKAYDKTDWCLFNAPDIRLETETKNETETDNVSPYRGTSLLGQKGIAFLRTGKFPAESAMLLRYGPTLNHGQLDEMSVMFFAKGREFSFDPGYYNTHYRMGWTRQTVAHNTVVINQKSQLEGAMVGVNANHSYAGGDLGYLFRTSGFQTVEARNENAYRAEECSLYARTIALVDISSSDVYAIDIFETSGGSVRDFPFHAQGEVFTPGDTLKFGSTAPGGSLAGSDIRWGDKVQADYRIEGSKEDFYWTAPGYGYGFLFNHAEASGKNLWSAEWKNTDKQKSAFAFYMLGERGRTILAADGPPRFMNVKYIIARDKGSTPSRFFTIQHPYEMKSKILDIQEIKCGNETASGSVSGRKFTPGTGLIPQGVSITVDTRITPVDTNVLQYSFIMLDQGEKSPVNIRSLSALDLVLAETQNKGEFISFPFTVSLDAVWNISFVLRQGPSFGIYGIYIDGKKIHTYSGAADTFDFGSCSAGAFPIRKGDHVVKFVLESETGIMGFVSMTLENTAKSVEKPAPVLPEPRTDFVIKAGNPEQKTEFAHGSFTGTLFFASDSAEGPKKIRLTRGENFIFKGYGLASSDGGILTGRIEKVDYTETSVTVSGLFPETLSGMYAVISNSEYTHSSTYTVKKCIPKSKSTIIVFEEPGFFLSSGMVEKKAEDKGTIHNAYYFPFATGLGNIENGYFNNKMILNDRTGKFTKITAVEKTLIKDVTVENNAGFEPGDSFRVCDITPGDEVIIPLLLGIDILEAQGNVCTINVITSHASDLTVPFPVKEGVYFSTPDIQARIPAAQIKLSGGVSVITVNEAMLGRRGMVTLVLKM